jgi:hypothetical protein
VVLDWLETFPGVTWQQRWLASGADPAGKAWTEQVSVAGLQSGTCGRAQLTGAAGRLVLLEVVRPAYKWLYQIRSARVLVRFRELRDPSGFAALDEILGRTERLTALDRSYAFHQLSRILMHNGGRLADITVADCIEAYRAQVAYTASQHGHWYRLLRQRGVLPSASPPTVWAACRRGQLSVEELVDGYQVTCVAVRDLLVDYLHERQAALDYTSLRQLATKLVLLFWRDLELHEPGIDSLHLSDDVARRWKERLRHIRYGRHDAGRLREDPNTILMAVRAFYADLAAWALEDPARWATWAAPNPVNGRDLLGQNKQKKRATARMHQRIRELAPLLPALVAAADEQRRHTSGLLAIATTADPGDSVEFDGEAVVRASLVSDPDQGGLGRPGVVYAATPEGGRRNLTLEEEHGFWSWAIIEVLRHTGVRIEEMLELTHRSFVAYTSPAPAKSSPSSKSPRPKPTRNGSWWSAPSWPKCSPPSSPGSAATHSTFLSSPATTGRNGSTARRCRSCSNAPGASPTTSSPPSGSNNSSTPPSKPLAWSDQTGKLCGSPPMISAGSSPPRPSPPASPSTSPPSSSATKTWPPPRPTSRYTTKTSSTTTEPSFVAVAPSAPAPSTENRPTANGRSFSATSNAERSSSESADGPTALPANTNTRASAAPCSAPTPTKSNGSSKSSTT